VYYTIFISKFPRIQKSTCAYDTCRCKRTRNSIAYIDLKFPAFKNSIVDLNTEVTNESDIISLFESKVSDPNKDISNHILKLLQSKLMIILNIKMSIK
jgi:hypothetical protein